MESRVRVALTCEVLRTTAWAARPTGHLNAECGVRNVEARADGVPTRPKNQ